MMNYRFSVRFIFKTMLFEFLDRSKFEEIRLFIDEIGEFGKVFDDRSLIEEFANYRLLKEFKHEHSLKKEL